MLRKYVTRTKIASVLFATAALVLIPAIPSIAQPDETLPTSAFKTYPVRPTAAKGAPNILLVMTDDVGFAARSTFGGPVPAPTAEALAREGLRYNAFHTTAMCSPTRAALLTGRNHHRVGAGLVADLSTDDPGYNAVIPDSAATIAEVLKANGYDTAFLGKHHNVPPWENTPLGPFERWGNGLGFDYFYGFHHGMNNQFRPALIENRNVVNLPEDPDYILDKDLADHAVSWLRLQRSLSPERPFLMYYAPGSAHSPHQAPATWIAKFKGRFDQGWDKMREEIFARQKAAGIIPASSKLTPRPSQIPAWDSLTPDQKRVSARLMEAYAGAVAYNDAQLGRVIDELKASGQYENTLIIFIEGDNGASAENYRGTNNDFASIHDNEPDYPYMLTQLDNIGGPHSFSNYPAGWAWSMDTPFQWSKQVASHLGGMRNGLIMTWEKGIKAHGEIREQFAHVIDIAPTIYEVAHVTPPSEVRGVKQIALDGTSMAYSFGDAKAPSQHHSQYFELLGNRAFYTDGWIASTVPENMPWNHKPYLGDPQKFKWSLYDLNNDYSQAVDLAPKFPKKLSELQADFVKAAEENGVFPLRGDFMGRFDARLRPSVLNGRQLVTYYPGPSRYATEAFPNFAGKSWSVRASIVTTDDGKNGTIVTQGGWVMGWGVFLFNGRPTFIYRASDHDPEIRLVGEPLKPGRHQIEASFEKVDGPGGTARLRVDGKEVASQPVPRASAFRGLYATVGNSSTEAVADDIKIPFDFQGTLEKVDISVN